MSLIKNVTLANGHKLAVLAPENVEAGREICRIAKAGKPLKKGEKPTAEHIYKVSTYVTNSERTEGKKVKNVYYLTCSEGTGNFKEHWDEEKNGPRPKRPRDPSKPPKEKKAKVAAPEEVAKAPKAKTKKAKAESMAAEFTKVIAKYL